MSQQTEFTAKESLTFAINEVVKSIEIYINYEGETYPQFTRKARIYIHKYYPASYKQGIKVLNDESDELYDLIEEYQSTK